MEIQYITVIFTIIQCNVVTENVIHWPIKCNVNKGYKCPDSSNHYILLHLINDILLSVTDVLCPFLCPTPKGFKDIPEGS